MCVCVYVCVCVCVCFHASEAARARGAALRADPPILKNIYGEIVCEIIIISYNILGAARARGALFRVDPARLRGGDRAGLPGPGGVAAGRAGGEAAAAGAGRAAGEAAASPPRWRARLRLLGGDTGPARPGPAPARPGFRSGLAPARTDPARVVSVAGNDQVLLVLTGT